MNVAPSFAFDVPAPAAVVVLVAVDLGVIAGVMGVFDFAHGASLPLGAYTVRPTERAGLPGRWGKAAAPFSVAPGRPALERGVVRRFHEVPIAGMPGTRAIGPVPRETVRGSIGGRFPSVRAVAPGQWRER